VKKSNRETEGKRGELGDSQQGYQGTYLFELVHVHVTHRLNLPATAPHSAPQLIGLGLTSDSWDAILKSAGSNAKHRGISTFIPSPALPGSNITNTHSQNLLQWHISQVSAPSSSSSLSCSSSDARHGSYTPTSELEDSAFLSQHSHPTIHFTDQRDTVLRVQHQAELLDGLMTRFGRLGIATIGQQVEHTRSL
jgi:hypothetical protein